MPRFSDWSYFPPSKPIAARGGIKARSKRGAFASSWWGRRWLEVLESLNLGGRLQRARSYARKGQVLDLAIEPGRVRASVQGSQRLPYKIQINVKEVDKKGATRLTAELSRSPFFLAKLLSREMPPDIETLFEAAGVALFPARASELHTDCSCPDWSNPCKHIAAVYYLLGEEFDRDPFLIFRLRGIDSATLLEGLAEPVVIEAAADGQVIHGEPESLIAGAPPPESFWEGTRPEVDLASVEPSRQPAPLLRRLGNLPFWRGDEPLADALEPAYVRAIDRAIDLVAR